MLSMPRIVRPDPFQELGPPLTRSSRIIKRNKELRKFEIDGESRQIGQSRTRHYIVDLSLLY
jgi:hypothetical protein